MSSFYSESSRRLQERFQTVALADRLEAAIITDRLSDADQQFVAGRDFFFLSTVGGDGFPTVSYKGGDVGLVTVVDPGTLAFPSYDGNGMYLSMGNLAETPRIGMLFIDFVKPTRLRVQGEATIDEVDQSNEMLDRYPGAELIVRVHITAAFTNCPRYVHRHDRVETSRYVPDDEGRAPLAPWKRIDVMQDVLPGDVRSRVEAEGGQISLEQYEAILDSEATGSDPG
ncbi:MAG: pyridoxamine 5'-phosphate oxidase family protein [Acidimicrobiales bacterium]